jgi:hypothetical protein
MEEQLKKPPNNGGTSSGSPSKLSTSQAGGNNNGVSAVKIITPSNPIGLEETGQQNNDHPKLVFNKDLDEEEKQQNTVFSPNV